MHWVLGCSPEDGSSPVAVAVVDILSYYYKTQKLKQLSLQNEVGIFNTPSQPVINQAVD